MKSFRVSLIILLGLFLIFSKDHSGCCLDAVWQLPRPSISPLQADTGRQILVVSWLVNHSGLVGDINEIQISRTENHTIIYNKNVSAPFSHKQTWTWTSDLPLECADHSARIRYFYNQSVASPWSEWKTHYGEEAKGKTKMFPSQRVLREGTSVMFCCVPPRGVNITKIQFKKENIPFISIGERVKAITVENLTIPLSVINAVLFTCIDTTGNTNRIWNYVSFPAQKPRNISCVTSNMITVTCTWEPGRYRNPYHRNNQTRTLHIENSNKAPISCEVSSCTFAAIPHLEQYNIKLVVKDQLGEEAERHSFNISDRVYPVVKWDGVSRGMADTTVSWIIKENLTQLDLICQVSVNPGSTTELNCSRPSNLCRVKLQHLLPDTVYSTTVRCSVNGRLWGPWTQPLAFKTCPFMTLNLWRSLKQMSETNSRLVTLLWQLNAPGSGTIETIQGYLVQWLQDGQNRTEWRGSAQTQAEVSISSGQYNFTVQAVSHTCPPITAHITIPKFGNRGQQHMESETLQVERRLSSSPAGGFNLSWPELDSLATCGYIVEWCIQGNEVPCTLRWKKIQGGNNTLSLPASDFEAGRRYTFYIYGCKENVHRLLEVQTGYSQELRPKQQPHLVEPAQSTSSSVTLEWSYNEYDPSHPAFITGYLVTVQEVGSNMLPDHTASVLLEDPQRKSVTIDGLKENHEYKFYVSALTKAGHGQQGMITVWTRTDYSTHLAEILTPILLLLGCAILMWPRRKTLRRGLEEIFIYPAGMNIKRFEMESFLNEAGERVQPHKVEECTSCDIEILNTNPPPAEKTALRDPEPLNAPLFPDSQSCPPSSSASCVLPQGYCPQSATLPSERLAPQHITCVENKSYFYAIAGDCSEPQEGMNSEVTSPSPELTVSLQESNIVVYGYISNNT